MSTSSDHALWQSQRRRAVTAPHGNLALVETRWAIQPADLVTAREGAPETAEVTPIQRTDLATGGTELGLRVWDAASPAIRSFDRIDTYDHDPAWVVSGRFVPV